MLVRTRNPNETSIELDSLEAQVQIQLGGRVRFLQVLLRGQGIVLKGRAELITSSNWRSTR